MDSAIFTTIETELWTCGDCTYQGGQRSPQAAARDGVEFELWPLASFMTPITNEALHGLFLFMPSELPVCYSYLAGKQHPVAHLICWLL